MFINELRNFRDLILQQLGFHYIDKTLLIKEIKDNNDLIIIINRPKFCGKTLNLSMLKYFYEITSEDNKYLFKNLLIAQYPNYFEDQGKYPVISLNVRMTLIGSSFENVLQEIAAEIVSEFKRLSDIILPNLTYKEANEYIRVLNYEFKSETLSTQILFLSKLLFNQYKKKVIILLDEYDSPSHAGYDNGFYKEINQFMTTFFSQILNQNTYLERAILTGTLYIEEKIFANFDNLKIYTINDYEFQDKFGFTEQEIKTLILEKSSPYFDDAQNWYNKYTFGKSKIFFPCIELDSMISQNRRTQHPKLFELWPEDDSRMRRNNIVIHKILVKANSDFKINLIDLLSDKSIYKQVNNGKIFPGIEKDNTAICSLLLHEGYLAYTSQEIKDGQRYCNLIIPNLRIKNAFKHISQRILVESLSLLNGKAILKSITEGDSQTFKNLFKEFFNNSTIVYELPDAEQSCLLLMISIITTLSDDYQFRYVKDSQDNDNQDLLLIPKNNENIAWFMQFKKASDFKILKSNKTVQLEQIIKSRYQTELDNIDIKNIKVVTIAYNQNEISFV